MLKLEGVSYELIKDVDIGESFTIWLLKQVTHIWKSQIL